METLILDTPSAKKSRVMDMPIYLQFIEFDARRLDRGMFRFYVIESRCGSEANTAAAGELLGDEHYLKNSEEGDRVRELPIPNVTSDIDLNDIDLVAVKSRLFIISQRDQIVYFDSTPQWTYPVWKTYASLTHERALIYHRGAAVSDDGDWIYTLLKNDLIRFRCDNLQDRKRDVFPNPYGNVLPRILLGLSGSKVFMCAPGDGYNTVQAGFYDVENHSWTVTVSFPIGPVKFYDLPSRTVLVSDSFLILYSEYHPELVPDKKEYCPGLYVYDIRCKKWLPEPVQGIADFPSSPRLDRFHVSVMQVRRDVLKLAFVWSALAMPERGLSYWSPEEGIYEEETEVHWSKFMLRIEDNETPDILPTVHAQGLSSGIILGGNTCLILSTAGKDCDC